MWSEMLLDHQKGFAGVLRGFKKLGSLGIRKGIWVA